MLRCAAACRFPFLLLDRVVEYEPQKYAVGYKNVTANDNFFTGHFPDRKIMPGACCWSCMQAWIIVITGVLIGPYMHARRRAAGRGHGAAWRHRHDGPGEQSGPEEFLLWRH